MEHADHALPPATALPPAPGTATGAGQEAPFGSGGTVSVREDDTPLKRASDACQLKFASRIKGVVASNSESEVRSSCLTTPLAPPGAGNSLCGAGQAHQLGMRRHAKRKLSNS